MMRKAIGKDERELRYIVTFQVNLSNRHCEVDVLDCKTDRYMSEKTMNKHGFLKGYASFYEAFADICCEFRKCSDSDIDIMGEIFGFDMYQMCIYR